MRRFSRFGTIYAIKKNVKSIHGAVILLVKVMAEASNFTKSNTPPWIYVTFFKLYKWF